jgi:hypothetical protein
MAPAHYFSNDGKDINMEKNVEFADQLAAFTKENVDLKAQLAKTSADFATAQAESTKKDAEVAKVQAEFAAKHTEFESKIAAMSVQLETTKKEAQFASDKNFVEKLVTEFRLTPAEKDEYIKFATENPASFADMKPLLQARPVYAPNNNTKITGAAARQANEGGADPYTELKKFTAEIQKDTKVSFTDAFAQACRDHTDLAAEYVATNAIN